MEMFLSHSSKDVAFCDQLASDLHAAGVKVCYAGWSLDVGDSLTEKLASEITGKAYFGIVLSPDSVGSSWVRYELRTALASEIMGRGVKVLPLLYRECDIPDALVDMVYLDFRSDYGSALHRLVKRLGVKPEAAQAAELAFNMRHMGELQSAVNLSGEEKPEEALRILKRAHHRNPTDPVPAMLASLNYQKIGNKAKALEWAKRAVDNSEHSFQGEIVFSAAEVALWAESLRRARDFLFKGVEIAPEAHELREMLAHVLLRLGERDEALRQAKRALALRPTATGYVALGRALGTDKPEEALVQFKTAGKLDPGSAAAHFFAGLTLMHLRRFAEAEPELQRCLQLDPQPEGYRTLAKVMAELRRYKDEIQIREHLVEMFPTDAQELLALGLAYEHIFEFRKAAETLEASVRLNPRDPETLLPLARIFFMREDRKAMDYANRYLATGPQGPNREAGEVIFKAAEARLVEGRAATGTEQDWAWRPAYRDMDEFREKWNPQEDFERFRQRIDQGEP